MLASALLALSCCWHRLKIQFFLFPYVFRLLARGCHTLCTRHHPSSIYFDCGRRLYYITTPNVQSFLLNAAPAPAIWYTAILWLLFLAVWSTKAIISQKPSVSKMLDEQTECISAGPATHICHLHCKCEMHLCCCWRLSTLGIIDRQIKWNE